MTAAQAEPEKVAVPTVFDEKATELARTYGDALLNVGQKEGRTDEILDELDEIRTFVVEKFPTFATMMGSPLRSSADKDRIISQAFEGRALPTSVRFLRVLNRHGRLELLGTILRSARETWNRRQKRQPVTVRSAIALTEAQQGSLRDRLSQSLNSQPILKLEVDPSLLGGLVIQVGDDVYDASVRSHLEQLRHRLIEGKTHEIQSRRDHFSHPE